MFAKSTLRVKRGLRQPWDAAGMLAVSAMLQVPVMPVHAATYKVLHDFMSHPSGAAPDGGLVRGADGTMYGTTSTGGFSGTGTIFSVDKGALFRFNPAIKVLTLLQSFDTVYEAPYAAPVVNSAGVVFGSLLDGRGFPGIIYRWTQADGYKVVQNFPAALCDGKDGIIYGIENNMLFRMIGAGKIAKLRDATVNEGAANILAYPALAGVRA